MTEKVARYQPGWYLAWNDVAREDHDYLSDYRLEKVASYPAFDDDDRGAADPLQAGAPGGQLLCWDARGLSVESLHELLRESR